MLCLGPAPDNIQSGIGGVRVLSPASPAFSRSSLSITCRMLSKLALCIRGLDGRLPLRIWRIERMLARSDITITCPAPGAAVTTVPGVAVGGGVGESVLNRG